MSHHIEGLEGRQLFAGGTIDKTFGAAGTAQVTFKTAKDDVLSHSQIVTDSQGRSYVATDTRSNTLQVRRLTADGQIDTAWAAKHHGLLLFTLNAGQIGQTRILVDRSDRLDVLANGQVQRFSADGTADAAFGTKGTLSLSNFATVGGIAIDATNKLFVSGNVKTGPKSNRRTIGQIVRYRSIGTVDPTFQSKGVYQFAPKSSAGYSSTGGPVFVLRDGSVLVTGSTRSPSSSPDNGSSSSGTTYEIKFNAAGALDTAYGRNGVSSALSEYGSDNGSRSVTIAGARSDGTVIANVLVASDTIDDPQYDSSNAVISANGQSANGLDIGPHRSDPDNDGVVVTSVVTQDNGGVLLAAGGSLYRDDATFAYDNTFNGGVAIGNVAAAALVPDGELLTVGGSSGGASLIVTRRYADDGLVTDFSAKAQRVPVSNLRFRVTYKAAAGINDATLGGNGLRVIGDDGTSFKPKLIDLADDGFGNVTATYKVGENWDAGDNGTYAVRLLDGYVKDKAGHVAGKRTLGTLTVAIS